MLNFGTIGSGWICEEYIYGAKDTSLWQLTAVYSRDKARAETFAEKHGAKLSFTDVEAMASCPEVDAVYVASPNALHYEQCKTILGHGKHVICEKPLCAQAEKVRELVRLAADKGLVFMEAIMFMHLPQRKILEEAIGRIGHVNMARLDFCQRSSKLDTYLAGGLPNIFNPKMETGALMDLGVYCVYPALYLFGRPERWSASSVLMKTGADQSGAITMEYPDKLVSVTYSKVGQAGAGSDFQGVDGTVSVESISTLGNMSLRLKDGSTETLFGRDEKYLLMSHESRDFYRYITEPNVTREEYLRCTELSIETAEFMEQARNSSGVRFPSDAIGR